MKQHSTTCEIKRVSSKGDRKKFIDFPYSHYKNEKYWVAPLKMEEKKLIDTANNPFYENADIALFLAYQNGTVCGRIAAIEDRRYNEYHGGNTGFFGFFESIDDEMVANKLVNVAADWLRGRGLTEVLGPSNPSMMDEIGILVDGFEYYPSILMPYHKDYYDRLLTSTGLEKRMDMYSYRVNQDTVELERANRGVKIVKKRYPDLHIRQIDLKNLEQEVEIIRDIYNKSWSGNWGFLKLTENEFAALAEDLKMIVDPKYAHIAEMDDEPVAFSIAIPDLNQALRHMNGRLFPIGLFKLLWYQRKINRIRTALMGVLPKYRGKGFDSLLHMKAIKNGLETGMYSAELGWVLETNTGMKHVAERIGAHVEKTYRMYGKEI